VSSFFAYTRPRGIQGNYRVVILLDLAETEYAEIYTAVLSEKRYIPKEPTLPLQDFQKQPGKRRWQISEYTRVVPHNLFNISIKDRDVVPSQTTIITATTEGFTLENRRVQIYDVDYGVIIFSAIELIDYDKIKAGDYAYDLLHQLFNLSLNS